MARQREGSFKSHVFALVREAGGFAANIAGGSRFQMPGLPDSYVSFPSYHGWIEFKNGNTKYSLAQQQCMWLMNLPTIVNGGGPAAVGLRRLYTGHLRVECADFPNREIWVLSETPIAWNGEGLIEIGALLVLARREWHRRVKSRIETTTTDDETTAHHHR